MPVDREDSRNWTFHAEEVSVGAYLVTANNLDGHQVEVTGTDLDEVVSRCKEAARDMDEASREHRS